MAATLVLGSVGKSTSRKKWTLDQLKLSISFSLNLIASLYPLITKNRPEKGATTCPRRAAICKGASPEVGSMSLPGHIWHTFGIYFVDIFGIYFVDIFGIYFGKCWIYPGGDRHPGRMSLREIKANLSRKMMGLLTKGSPRGIPNLPYGFPMIP